MTTIKAKETIKTGDKVTFDNDKIEIFKNETRSEDKAVMEYQN